MLNSIRCPSCTSGNFDVEYAPWTAEERDSADTLRCAECGHRWTLAIPAFPQAG